MRITRDLEFHPGSREEKLSYTASDFPYMASQAELDDYREPFVPWHWHKAVEIFYMESGELKYCTPNRTMVFPAGSGGMVNSNVLHMTEIQKGQEKNTQLLHIFEPELIGGGYGSLINQKYIMPVTSASQVELIGLYPDHPAEAEIIHLIRGAFQLSEKEFAYEVKIREALSQIWIRLFQMCAPALREKGDLSKGAADKVKLLMAYIHEHYKEKISVAELAEAAFLSERDCYRVFQKCLHMTPAEYIKSYRLQAACQMLAEGEGTATEIAYACGLGDASRFGKIFRQSTGMTPIEYRKKWQDHNKI